MFCKEKMKISVNYSQILQNLNYAIENSEDDYMKELLRKTQEKIIQFRDENNKFSIMLLEENRELKKTIFKCENPSKFAMTRRIRFVKRMELEFKKGFETLGNSRTIAQNHKAYSSFFNVRKLYKELKGGEE